MEETENHKTFWSIKFAFLSGFEVRWRTESYSWKPSFVVCGKFLPRVFFDCKAKFQEVLKVAASISCWAVIVKFPIQIWVAGNSLKNIFPFIPLRFALPRTWCSYAKYFSYLMLLTCWKNSHFILPSYLHRHSEQNVVWIIVEMKTLTQRQGELLPFLICLIAKL